MTAQELIKLAVFEGKQIRRVLQNEEWWFAVIDVVEVLTDSSTPKRYWSDLKRKLAAEGFSEAYEKIVRLKMPAPDGKLRLTDCATTKTLLRIIQSIPSPKAEPLKRWLARTTKQQLFIPTPVPKPLLAAARSLRGEMTNAEQCLWNRLCQKQLGGFRFRRQHPFQRYVLDFYCCEAKLAIELDGGHHLQPEAHARDNERSSFLESHGICVIRFWNSAVFDNLEGVLTTILLALQSSPSPTLPLQGREQNHKQIHAIPGLN